eukprot:gene4490-79_t
MHKNKFFQASHRAQTHNRNVSCGFLQSEQSLIPSWPHRLSQQQPPRQEQQLDCNHDPLRRPISSWPPGQAFTITADMTDAFHPHVAGQTIDDSVPDVDDPLDSSLIKEASKLVCPLRRALRLKQRKRVRAILFNMCLILQDQKPSHSNHSRSRHDHDFVEAPPAVAITSSSTPSSYMSSCVHPPRQP